MKFTATKSIRLQIAVLGLTAVLRVPAFAADPLPEDAPVSTPTTSQEPPAASPSDPQPAAPVDAMPQPDPDPALIVECANHFGLALFKRLLEEEGNLLLSPYALQPPLAFLLASGRGETEMEVRAALQYPEPDAYVLASVAALRRQTERKEGNATVRSGTSLWVQQGIPLDPDLLVRMENQVGVAAGRMDLIDGLDRARTAMNAWSQFETGGLVSEPLPPGALRRDALMILLNTFHFRGGWGTPFPEESTAPAPFSTTTGDVRLPMMRQTARFDYYDAGDAQFLRVPLASRHHELLLLLPRDTDAMPRLLRRLTFPELQRWESLTWTRAVDFHFPRLTIRSGLPLVPHLRALGMEDAFSERGDFSPLTGEVRVSVDRFQHNLTLVFGEAGISMPPLTPPPSPPPSSPDTDAAPVAFHVNRPFLFLLRDTRTGILLAMGRIDTPDGTPLRAEPETPAVADEEKPPHPVFRSRPGFGPWDFGMPMDAVPGRPGGPYRYLAPTRQFMTDNARWNLRDDRTATLSFNEEGRLSGVRIQLYTGRNPDGVAAPLLEMIQAMQSRYVGVVFPDGNLPVAAAGDPEALSVAMRVRVERLREERPHAPAEAGIVPRYQPPQTWISGHLLYEESLGYAVFLQYQWDPNFPGTPLPEDPSGDRPAP